MSKHIEFCGAFNGRVALRPNETAEQLHERIEAAMQSALDRSCKRLNVVVGVDMGEIENTLFLSAKDALRTSYLSLCLEQEAKAAIVKARS